MWGIIPAAGQGSRIQPLAFSKELLPVGVAHDGDAERPCAVSEYLIERMMCAGADKLAFIVRPGKSDIVNYYGAGYAERDRSLSDATDARGLVRRDLSRQPADWRRTRVDRAARTRSGFPRTALRECRTMSCRS